MHQSHLKSFNRADFFEPQPEQFPDLTDVPVIRRQSDERIIDASDLAKLRSRAPAATAGVAILASLAGGIAFNHPLIGAAFSTLLVFGYVAIEWGNEVIDNTWL